MDSMTSLLRFLYLGTDECVYKAKSKPLAIDGSLQKLQCIQNMAEGRHDLPFSVIKRVIQSKSLPRNDEAIFALAFCVRCVSGDVGVKLRGEIYNSINDVILTDNDLFLFVKWSSELLPITKGFGRGMRKAIGKWYGARTALELANLFGKNRNLHGWGHIDLIKLCHLKFQAGEDRSQVIQSLFKKGWDILNENEQRINNGTLPEGMTRLCHIIKFKTNESVPQALQMIEQHSFGVAYLPSHLYEHASIWEMIVPKMTYTELLKFLPTLYALNLLKTDSTLAKKICTVIGYQNLIAASKTHPLELLVLKKNYEKNQRYSEPVKQSLFARRRRIIKRNLLPNVLIVKRLNTAISQALACAPKVGSSFFVTLDLRHGNKNRSVFGMNNVTCMDAMVLIALWLVKREKNITLQTFSDAPDNLKPLTISERDNFENAYKNCMANAYRKTCQSLATPLKFAKEKMKAKYDVFLTITDSVARFCRNGKIPIDEFKQYKMEHKQAKYIVLNLARAKADLKMENEKGFLEICGLNASVPKLIHAFAKNQFS